MPPEASAESTPGVITRCLQDWGGGDADALSRLTTAVYKELRRVAAGILAGGSGNQTVQPPFWSTNSTSSFPGYSTSTGRAGRSF
jgi:hypothetical protein